ncbi:hypothetical protein GCM10012275_39620 [Longimycelium tulufanense]|uniref:Uncharacterized protein n=1 Tax=Longimycelium tulufanense TaxID=907463 RepID=A0A8J3CAJ3_9PSEU|nr:hypothetical protein [Longimycelium tulufanense]GGM65156.1 hypothetical protein GCM10012275_39620 [Longimycelium tulufanense]
MYALFSADVLRAEAQGQLCLDDVLVEAAAPAASGEPVMPAPLALVQVEDLTGQGVLGA